MEKKKQTKTPTMDWFISHGVKEQSFMHVLFCFYFAFFHELFCVFGNGKFETYGGGRTGFKKNKT